MQIILDGNKIKTVDDFHKFFAYTLNIQHVYGENLHALWDVLSASLERPSTLIWKDSSISKLQLGVDFDSIVNVLQRAVEWDEKFKLKHRFTYELN